MSNINVMVPRRKNNIGEFTRQIAPAAWQLLKRRAPVTFKVCSGLWITVIVGALISALAGLQLPPGHGTSHVPFGIQFLIEFSHTFVGWLLLGDYRIITWSLLAFLGVITVAARFITGIVRTVGEGGGPIDKDPCGDDPEEVEKDNEVLRDYLQWVKSKTVDLKLSGIARLTFLSVRVPLDGAFVHLHAVPGRPAYAMRANYQAALDELNRRHDLTPDERDVLIAQLRFTWVFEAGQNLPPAWQRESISIDIEEILRRCEATVPLAVILGAPGAGKSTTLQWFAYHMAFAYLEQLEAYSHKEKTPLPHDDMSSNHQHHNLQAALAPAQIPIVVRIKDYIQSKAEEPGLSFEQFLEKKLDERFPRLYKRIQQELQQGHCLLLLDGLSDVDSNDQRRAFIEDSLVFIDRYSLKNPGDEVSTRQPNGYHNRFIITSRIEDEPVPLRPYTHYTLLDFGERQVDEFLHKWYPLYERYGMLEDGRQALSEQEKSQAEETGRNWANQLLSRIKQNPGLKRLALNPFMLTIMALLYRRNYQLPHRRIDLYEVATETLLSDANQANGQPIFDDTNLAKKILARLAFDLQSSNDDLTYDQVKQITALVMTDYYQGHADRISEKKIVETINKLSDTSGLFGPSDQNRFSFMHDTFREYYAAYYLWDQKTPEDFKNFVLEHYRSAGWREPLLLAIAYKSGQGNENILKVNDVLLAITQVDDPYDTILQRHLLFVARCLVDCKRLVDNDFQQKIAAQLFELYGDAFGKGRYSPLQHEIEEIALLWLRAQPEPWSALTKAWSEALGSSKLQEGAVHLLAAIAPDLPSCPSPVRAALVPPLLQLAGLQDLPCPQHIREDLPQPPIQAGSSKVVDYACITLRLLDSAGPAGWLHEEWRQWNLEQPELLVRLTEHAHELEYFLTPAAFPGGDEAERWRDQQRLVQQWQQGGKPNPDLQTKMLAATTAARFPHAYLFKRLLDKEGGANPLAWRDVWHDLLQEEMDKGRSATYQSALSLRLLLCKVYEPQRRLIAEELIAALTSPSQHIHALLSIINVFLILKAPGDPRYQRETNHLRYSLGLLEALQMRSVLEFMDIVALMNPQEMGEVRLPKLRTPAPLALLSKPDPRSPHDLYINIDPNQVAAILCSTLDGTPDADTAIVLLALYSMLYSAGADNRLRPDPLQQVQKSIQKFEDGEHELTIEQRILVESIKRLLGISSSAAQAAEISLDGSTLHILENTERDLLNGRPLRRAEIQALLEACNVSTEQVTALNITRTFTEVLTRHLTLEADAFQVVLESLDSGRSMKCAVAALILQNALGLPWLVREEAAQKIAQILKKETLVLPPLDLIISPTAVRLDDVLFETLKVLADQ